MEQLQAMEAVKDVVNQVTGAMMWALVPLAALMFFHIAGERIIQGILWKVGRTYNTHDAIVFDGQEGRIGHIGLWNTEFTIYIKRDDKIVGGYTMEVANDELKKHSILKPLQLHEVPKELRTIHR